MNTTKTTPTPTVAPERPATPAIDIARTSTNFVYPQEVIDRLVAEHDALVAHLEDRLRALEARRAPVPYKGVTYREGKWWYAGAPFVRVADLISLYGRTFTDADHAPLLALKDAPPRDVRGEVVKIIEEVARQVWNKAKGYPAKDEAIVKAEAIHSILALLTEGES